MQFLDEVKIIIKSGNGGNGAVSFRREKHVANGGPDGGNGGNGGDIIIRCAPQLSSLINFKFRRHLHAEDGSKGERRNRTGKQGKDLFIDVPMGTQIFLRDREVLLYDIQNSDRNIILMKGGRGGLGNINFKSSINQAPKKAQKGFHGEEMGLTLNLKLFANVGLLGLPNAGKSTFLSRMTNAKPKIADYPFSTLRPQLGIVKYLFNEFVMADVPGLIEHSSSGQGLGIQFLKHLEKCQLLLHVVDISVKSYLQDYQIIRQELERFGQLSKKKELILFSKTDLVDDTVVTNARKKLENLTESTILAYSSMTNTGLACLKKYLYYQVEKLNKQ
jgi:GTP-binding protein